jgi:hypothetical protein
MEHIGLSYSNIRPLCMRLARARYVAPRAALTCLLLLSSVSFACRFRLCLFFLIQFRFISVSVSNSLSTPPKPFPLIQWRLVSGTSRAPVHWYTSGPFHIGIRFRTDFALYVGIWLTGSSCKQDQKITAINVSEGYLHFAGIAVRTFAKTSTIN